MQQSYIITVTCADHHGGSTTAQTTVQAPLGPARSSPEHECKDIIVAPALTALAERLFSDRNIYLPHCY
jgi:hypothetical protein